MVALTIPAALCETVPSVVSETLVAVSGALKVIVGEVSDTELFDVTAALTVICWVVNVVVVVLAVSDALFSVMAASMSIVALCSDSVDAAPPAGDRRAAR